MSPSRKKGIAWSAQSGGMSQRIQRGARGQPSSAPRNVPRANDSTVVVPRSATVHGSASAIIAFTVRG